MIGIFSIAAITAIVLAAVVPLPASVPISGALVRVDAALDSAAWTRLPHASARAADHAGKMHSFEGVRLVDVIRDAGAPSGAAIRGEAARSYVVASGADGYAAIFSLGELSASAAGCAPLVVDQEDGAPMGTDHGPVQIVAPCDASQARWVRHLTQLTVVTALSPLGATPAPAAPEPPAQ